jgi:predicted N-acetyltransferase YhbS
MGASEITIRRFEAGDAEEVSRFITAALESGGKADYGEKGAEQLSHLYLPNLLTIYSLNDEIYIALSGTAIAGAGILSQDQIRGIFVAGGLAPGGVGEQLVRTMEKSAAGSGRKKLSVTAGMQSAEFYRQLGYNPIGDSDEFIGDEVVKMFRLEKSLA